MSLHTPIEWCDSAVNPVMGCDGCELWQPDKGIRHCYAGTIHQVRAGNPDVVVCDIMMPKLNGLEVVERLQADEATADIPVILLSAKAQTSEIERGLATVLNIGMLE